MQDDTGLLAGLTVVDMSQFLSGPYCSLRLSDLGARVIKIERPEGDFARGYDTAAAGQSSYFVWLNRGKESVALDLTSDAGKAALTQLIDGADVLVQNLKPGALARLGFPPERLARDWPRLITCSISGYGEDGPMAARKAYDLLIQAESGLSSITGGPDGPARVGVSIVDIATGATAHAAILEALIGRGITGRGTAISVSMFDVMADWLTVPLLNHEGGKSPKRLGLAHPSIAPYGVFRTGDGADILAGGLGRDILTGAADARSDVFVFTATNQTGLAGNADVITDFHRGTDLISLNGIDANVFAGGDQAFAWTGGRAAAHAVWAVAGTGGWVLSGDVNGDGRADFQIWLQGANGLGASDLLL